MTDAAREVDVFDQDAARSQPLDEPGERSAGIWQVGQRKRT